MLKTAIAKNEAFVPPLFHYLLAETYFQGADYQSAKRHYLQYINLFNGKNQLRDSKMKLAMCAYYLGNADEFDKYWQQAKCYQRG